MGDSGIDQHQKFRLSFFSVIEYFLWTVDQLKHQTTFAKSFNVSYFYLNVFMAEVFLGNFKHNVLN